MMDAATWTVASERIRQTISLYCQLLDDQRYDDVGALFAPSARLWWQGIELTGVADIVENLHTTQLPLGSSRHLPYGPVIRFDDDASGASVWTDVIVTVHPPDAPAVIGWTGRYHQRWVRDDDRWLIDEHIAVDLGDELPPGVEAVSASAAPPRFGGNGPAA